MLFYFILAGIVLAFVIARLVMLCYEITKAFKQIEDYYGKEKKRKIEAEKNGS